MNVVLRFDVEPAETERFLEQSRVALQALSARPGYLRAWVGRSADEPGCWTLVCEWDSVGAYRRALSAYDVKLRATPLLARARDEPSAFEPLLTDDGREIRGRGSDRAAEPGREGHR
ncbi:MAG: antibiotic biosynthesis monooxygenase family protein [Geodermatophilaceae bacterium]